LYSFLKTKHESGELPLYHYLNFLQVLTIYLSKIVVHCFKGTTNCEKQS
jgi:hypothetical protein